MTVDPSRPDVPDRSPQSPPTIPVAPPPSAATVPLPRPAPPSQVPHPGLPPYGYGPPLPGRPGPAERPRRRTGLLLGLVALGVVVVAGLVVGAFLWFRGHVTLDTDKAAAEIGRITQQQFGVAPTDVRCPSDVPLEKGTATTCTARLEGQPTTYQVTQTDDKGNVRISGDDTITTVRKLQDWLAGQVGQQAGVPTTASCDAGGHTVLVGATTVHCTVTSTQDPTDQAAFLAHVDDKGTASYERAP
jgi:Domain of unknown function (DUF4333)